MKNPISHIKSCLRREMVATSSPGMKSLEIKSPKIYRPTTLPGLPLELFFQICGLLSPVDLKCMSFCDRRFFSRLYDRYHGFPPLVGDKKFSILARLQRDMPDHFACHVCNKFHRYVKSESFGLSGIAHRKTSKLPCDNKTYKLEPELKDGVGMSLRTHTRFEHSRCRLSLHQVKLAMRRFHSPNDVHTGISTQSLSYTQVLLYDMPVFDPFDDTWSYSSRIPTLFSIQAQICPNPLGLHIRMQDIMLLDKWDDPRIEEENKPLTLYEICCHTTVPSKKSELDRVLNGKEPWLSYTCHQCATDCIIEAFDFDSRVAFVMTRWINLGTGVDHRDPLWNVHAWRASKLPAPRLPKSMTVESPYRGFEPLASETFQTLRARNLSYLKEKQYKKGKHFVRLGQSLWYISYQDPSMKHRSGSLWPWLRGFERSNCDRPSMGPIVKPWDGRKKKRSSSDSDDWLILMMIHVALVW